MPLYEYECRQCGRIFEKIQRFSDPPDETCEACGGLVARLISTSAFQFKGTGWYVTDYPRKSAAPDASGGDGQDKKSEKKETPAGESKPTKTDTKDTKDAKA